MEIEPPDTLLGLYQGTPLPSAARPTATRCPIAFCSFRGRSSAPLKIDDDLVVAIGETLIHEIGHYFGLSEEEIEEIEEKYWNQAGDD